MQHMYHAIVFSHSNPSGMYFGDRLHGLASTNTLEPPHFSADPHRQALRAPVARLLFALYHLRKFLQHMYQYAIYPLRPSARQRTELRETGRKPYV
jgi:hypothetical protein